MAVTNSKRKSTEERAANRERIAQDKARSRRWEERRRKEKTVRGTATNTAITAVAVTNNTNEESSVLNDFIARQLVLLQELSEIDTAIEVI